MAERGERRGVSGQVLARAFETSCLRKLFFPHLFHGAQDQRPGAEQDQLPRESTGFCLGNCQETETHMVRTYYTPPQPLQNHPSRHLSEATPWPTEELLKGQHQGVDIFVYVRTTHDHLPQKRMEEDFC